MERLMQSWFSGPFGQALVRLLNMSAAAGVLICAVVLLRLALRRAPKWTRGILWAIVAVQLVCPVTLRSPLSVYRFLPRSNAVKSDQAEIVRLGGGSEKPLLILDTPQIAGHAPPAQVGDASAAPAQPNPSVYLPAAGTVWLAGVAVMLLYALVSWLSLRRRVRASVPLEGRARLCDAAATPFILGVVHPRIYLPSGLSDTQRRAALAHEAAHLRRGDHWWKLLGWLLLAVHWFNPLVWLAYILLCRDIELACDERAVRDMDTEARADYSQALLDCAAPRALVRVCPLAFGEVGVKARIKAVLNYKKPAFWIVVAAVVICIVVAICFLTRPGPIEAPEPSPAAVTPTPRPTEAPAPELTAAPDVIFSTIDPEHARLYWLDEAYYPDDPFHAFSIILDMDAGLFQYYETPISSYIGLGQFAREGDILTIGDGRVNRFRMEDDKLVWLEEGSDNFTFVKLTDGATFSLAQTSVAEEAAPETPRRMTLDDVRTLAKKGEALTWDDLLAFEGEDVGSGLYIYRFPIDDDYCLLAQGGSLEGTPWNVQLLHADEAGGFRPSAGYSIDIRTEDVDAFLTAQADKTPFLTVASGGQSVAAYPILEYEHTWTEHGWLYADGAPAAAEVLEHPERIPTLTLSSDGLSFTFGDGASDNRGLRIYSEQLELLEVEADVSALSALAPGTWYCAVDVNGPRGRYIESEGAYETSGYRCVFRLVVPEEGPSEQ